MYMWAAWMHLGQWSYQATSTGNNRRLPAQQGAEQVEKTLLSDTPHALA